MVTIRASPPDQSPRTSYCTIVLFGSQVISLVRLTGLPAFNSVHPRRIRCRSQHRGMGYHPLRMKIRWGCPPRVLSPVDSHACPGSHEYRAWGQQTSQSRALAARWLVSWSGTRLTTAICSGAFFPGGAWGADEVVDGPFYVQKPLISLLRPHYTWCVVSPSLGGIARVSCPKPVSWRLRSRPKLTVLRARPPLPCMPWLSCRSTKPRHSNKCTRVVPTTSAKVTLLNPEMGMVPRYSSRYNHANAFPLIQPLHGPCLSTGQSALRTIASSCRLLQWMPLMWAGALHTTGMQPRGSGQGLNCFGTSTVSSCWQCY